MTRTTAAESSNSSYEMTETLINNPVFDFVDLLRRNLVGDSDRIMGRR